MYGDMRTNVFGKLFGPILIRKVKLFPSLYNIFIHIKPSLLETMVIIMQVDFVNCKFIHCKHVSTKIVDIPSALHRKTLIIIILMVKQRYSASWQLTYVLTYATTSGTIGRRERLSLSILHRVILLCTSLY
jgi:hypothetical protein